MKIDDLRPRTGMVLLLPLAAASVVLLAGHVVAGEGGRGQKQLPTTSEDFFQPGTQPDASGLIMEPFEHSSNCASCHGDYYLDREDEPWNAWVTSMMAQSARDPVWQAAVAVANQDAAGAGETCIRCHAPVGWLAGRSTGGEIEDLAQEDFDGITCHFCHRMVDPVLTSDSTERDAHIVQDLQFPPAQPGNGRHVIDPEDVRRGPFEVPLNMHGAPIIISPFHQQSELCATCHDVSVPTYTRNRDGTYVLNPLGEPHPTQNIHDMFPEQRTYSEWLHSKFARQGVYFADRRFGGNHPTGVMRSCQDCHMPDAAAGGCFAWEFDPFFERPDMPLHHFSGANTWVLGAVYDEYGSIETGLTPERVDMARARTEQMLRAASDMELVQLGGELNVRIINLSGHKLPTGYPEGRRMWLNVQFFDDGANLVAEHGHYDSGKAELDVESTKVYEARHGIDESVAAATGLPEGTLFHLALNNKVYFDNRIPPIGFDNVSFEAVGAAPVGCVYDDGQYWDDTQFTIPSCATLAVVTLYYQTTTREYIEFLRDTVEGRGETAGTRAYNAWLARGKSAPVDMDIMKLELARGSNGDTDADGDVDVDDLVNVILAWGLCTGCSEDTDCDGDVDVDDLVNVILGWG